MVSYLHLAVIHEGAKPRVPIRKVFPLFVGLPKAFNIISAPSQRNPATKTDWERRVLAADTASKTIHDLPSVKSASRISNEQFLALRILWKRVKLLP